MESFLCSLPFSQENESSVIGANSETLNAYALHRKRTVLNPKLGLGTNSPDVAAVDYTPEELFLMYVFPFSVAFNPKVPSETHGVHFAFEILCSNLSWFPEQLAHLKPELFILNFKPATLEPKPRHAKILSLMQIRKKTLP